MSFVMQLISLTTIFYVPIYSDISINQTKNDLFDCLGRIYQKHSEPYSVIISDVSNLNEFFDYPSISSSILYSTNNLTAQLNLWFQILVIVVENITSFQHIFETLRQSDSWNPKGRLLVGYLGDENIQDIFEISWSDYVVDIDVVAWNHSDLNVYTFYPYKKNVFVNEILGKCNGLSLDDLFPNKTPLDLNGYEVKAMAYVIPPYVINLNKPREKSAKTGIEVTIIHNVAQRMNFSLKFMKNPHTHWGYRFHDGSFSMMYKALIDREIDVIFGFTYRNSSYMKDLDASFCHLSDSSVWFFPTAPQMASWKNLTNIFEGRLWMAIFFMFIFNGLAWWFIGRKREPSSAFNDIVICIMSSMYTLLQGSVEGPITWKLRLIFIQWLMICLLIYTAYQSQLISILTSRLYEHQMTTLEQLIESNSDFGFYPTIEDAYRGNSSTSVTIFQKYQACPLTAECLNRTAFQRDYAVVKNRRQVLYLMPRYYTFPNGRDMLYDTKINAFTTRETYYMRKGFPLLERFDSLLMLMAANGLITKWDADTRYFVLKIESEPRHKPLTLGHLEGAFFVLTLGIGCAILVLGFELARGHWFT